MKIRNVLVIPFLLLVLTAVSCGNSKSRNDRTETVDKEVIKAPEFDADSAYQYIQVQADFGPRVPNTQAHKECGEYLAGQLEKFGAKVYNQYADLIAYDGTILKSRNIIGAYKPDVSCFAPIGTAARMPTMIPTRRITILLYWE